jgi:hypothetical protein
MADVLVAITAHAPKSSTAPPSCRRSGPIASSRRDHTPNGTAEKSIEAGRITAPPAFSPTKFLRRLRSAETLTSFAFARLAQSCLPGSCPGFPATLTTIAFGNRSLQWLETST